MKRQMHNIAAFVGKRIDANRWAIPEGYRLCAKTWKLHPESRLERSFAHWVFPREFLLQHGIYVEDADWLSDEGHDEIMSVLECLGLRDAYNEAYFRGTSLPLMPEAKAAARWPEGDGSDRPSLK
jgi:hypothetical protein